MTYRQSFRIIALVASIALGPSAMAAKFTMGNFDREGSRSIPGDGNLTVVPFGLGDPGAGYRAGGGHIREWHGGRP